MNPTLFSAGIRRTCRCGRLLAVQHGASFHVRYRELDAVISGEVSVRCPRCHVATRLVSESPVAA
jgi:phage FluMu protein Com